MLYKVLIAARGSVTYNIDITESSGKKKNYQVKIFFNILHKASFVRCNNNKQTVEYFYFKNDHGESKIVTGLQKNHSS